MKSLKLFISASLCFVSLCAFAQNTRRLTADRTNEYGLAYVLPSVEYRLTLAAKKTVKTPGEFALYAQQLLHLESILTPSESWEISGAELSPVAVADDEERYLVQFRNGSSPTMRVTPEGFPVAINDDDYVVAVAAASSLQPVPQQPSILQSEDARQAITQDMIRATSVAKRAELAAARIMEIRQTRADIISGQADGMPSDGAAMQLALDNLARQEAALTAMFIGTVQTSVEVKSFSVKPPADNMPLRFVVARLSQVDGLVDPDNLTGAPIYATFSDIVNAELPVNDRGQVKTFPKGGFAYRIPGQANIQISFMSNVIAKADAVAIPQYGVVFGLDPNLFTDKRNPSYLRLDPLTGAVVELGLVQSESR